MIDVKVCIIGMEILRFCQALHYGRWEMGYDETWVEKVKGSMTPDLEKPEGEKEITTCSTCITNQNLSIQSSDHELYVEWQVWN